MMMTMIENKRRLSFTSMIWNIGGAACATKELSLGLVFKLINPHQTQAIGGTRDAAQPLAMARLRNFWLMCRMSSGVGGRGCARFRADARSVKAIERDKWLTGCRRRSELIGGGWRRQERASLIVLDAFAVGRNVWDPGGQRGAR